MKKTSVLKLKLEKELQSFLAHAEENIGLVHGQGNATLKLHLQAKNGYASKLEHLNVSPLQWNLIQSILNSPHF